MIVNFRVPAMGAPDGYIAATARVIVGQTKDDFMNFAVGGVPKPGEPEIEFKKRLLIALMEHMKEQALEEAGLSDPPGEGS